MKKTHNMKTNIHKTLDLNLKLKYDRYIKEMDFESRKLKDVNIGRKNEENQIEYEKNDREESG